MATRSNFTVKVGVDGAEEAVKQLGDVEGAQKKAAEESKKSNANWSSSLDEVGGSLKEVGKDLDNVGLASFKSSAMMAEGALSVVKALGAGGVGGLIGAATVAAGVIYQLADAHKTAEAQAAKQFETYSKEVTRITDLILAARKVLTQEDFAKKEAELLARKAANEARYWDMVVARDKVVAAKRFAAQMEWVPGAGPVATKAVKDAQEELLKLEQDYGAETAAIERETRANRDAAAKADAVAFGEWKAANDKKTRQDELKASEDAAKKKWDAEVTLWHNVVALANESAKKRADKAREFARSENQDIMKMADATASQIENRIARANDELVRLRGEFARSNEDRVKSFYAFAVPTNDEITRLLKLVEGTKEAALAAALRRDAERELAAEVRKRREEDTKAIVVQAALSAETMAYGVVMSVVQPIVTDFTDALATLGTINRENYRDLVIFSNELPAIIAREVQARLGAMGAEATGKAIMSSADGLRETALGFGMLFINPADAAAHFTAAGVHFAAASAYGTLGTGALIGAGSIGALRGGGGPIALTQEEKDTLDMRRGRDGSFSFGGDGGGDGGGGGSIAGRQASGDGTFVVNVNQYSTISSADEQKGARAVAIVTRRALSNAFDRRRMRG